MSTEATFLQTIRERPEDDFPRLMFADWLDEHGHSPRAEFIRLQCELAKITEVDSQWPALKVRSDELEATCRNDWVGPIHNHPSFTATFRRGFVDRVDFTGNTSGKEDLRHLQVAFSRNAITEMSCYWSTGGLSENEVAELLRAMTHWPDVRSLRKLGLSFHRSGESAGWNDDEIEYLVSNPHLANLASLELSSTVSPVQLARFDQATYADSLRQFRTRIGHHGVHPEWCLAWKRLHFLRQLIELDLSIDWHTDQTVESLLEADLPNVRVLNLGCNDITDGIFAVLGRWPRLRQIHELNLDANNLGPDLLSQLVAIPTVNLRALRFGGEIRRFHSQGYFFPRTASLDPNSFARFAHSSLARQLTELMVVDVNTGGPLLRALSEAPLHALTKLIIYGVEFEHSDLQQLFSADWFSHLRYLRIGRDSSTDADAELFLTCPLHPHATLSLGFGYSNSQVTEDMKRILRERFGSRINISPE